MYFVAAQKCLRDVDRRKISYHNNACEWLIGSWFFLWQFTHARERMIGAWQPVERVRYAPLTVVAGLRFEASREGCAGSECADPDLYR